MSTIHSCDEHGFFTTEKCPVCESIGAHIISSERRMRLSKFMSGALRHFPSDADLELDKRGWTAYDALVESVLHRYSWSTPEQVAGVIATDPKGRYERDAGRARATYGHSVAVDLEPRDTSVPARLYHGTAPGNRTAILQEGLKPMSRQAVHLSGTESEARTVGQRHAAEPIVLTVDSRSMVNDGHQIAKRGRGIYTTDTVPPEYITEGNGN
ncbi:RNA 2'-phosphotransferase [Halococcus hamelinensis]|uniref:Probable RNA 2'-phosphotransferase n=1 Tax=Halococcus hamelinensis 100A6 TaxID=1132509 RepID=M0LZP4_9EURY|nr:RNA 2'-phosphotransferase [Halococcus hamelinensis]EMA37590.1 RNA 2'-phosphotransferase [Halococcus hamelinensis 100A6]